MVQRKVASKLLIGIQAVDGVNNKSDKHRPPSPHHQQDGKNRGADLKKKKMKKSRSFKRCSDFESLRPSPTFRREIPQPGKPPPPPPPPPPDVPAQKQSAAIKGSLDGSPNYMKSTSSFDARREQQQQQQQRTHHQVSSQKSQTPNKSPKKITPNSSSSSSSKLSSVSSGHKLPKTLSRTSSLKLVRTLIKSPSFKPVRASTRKCSQAVLCENLQVERSTCSSTLKDSKFPNYLDLSPGATESQGTSVMKVCPYTYCSLNGHHHAPLPPLKCFLSARRHMLKTQKRMKKLGCLSPRPRRARPSSDTRGGAKEIPEHITLDVKPSIQEELDSNSPTIHPLIQEDDQMDYFIEIYARDTEDAAETTGGRSKQEGEDKDETNETAAEHDGGGQVVEMFSDEAPLHSEIDFEDNLYNTGEFISTEMEAAEEVRLPFSTQEEEESPEYPTNQSDFKIESPASIELDETESETCDMEWEEGQYSAPSLNDEVANSTQTNNENHFNSDSSFGANNSSLHDEHIFKSDEIVSSYFDDIFGDEGPKEFFEEEAASSGGGCGNSRSVSEGSYQHLGADKSMQEFNNQNYLVSSTSDVFKESTIEEKDGNAELYNTAITLSPIEEPIEKPSALLGNQECDSCHDFTEPRHDETHEDYSSSDNNIEVYQSNAVREEAFVGSLLPKTEVPEMNQSVEKELPTADAGDRTEEENEEEEQEGAAKSLIRIPTSEMLQGLSEDHQDMTKQDDNEIQFGVISEDGEANQSIVDEGLPAETLVQSSVRESQTNNNVEDQNHPDHEAQSFKISDSIDSEDQAHWELNKVSVAKNSSEDDNEMEVQHSTMSDPKESFPSSKKAASKQAKIAFFHGRNHSSQKQPKDPNNNLRIIRGKRPVEESEEARKFNPREPNYLPIEADPEAEKVDLRHQMVDEKKNSEEWMLDYALRQAVTKLAPARKRKVSLLVEAFEKVMPIPKYESHLKHTSAAFAHARSIQACS
ncbi:hypothetical protein HYC85_010497 [Camellia sinensis]|uniref:Calmodulin-binding domain-containing protein n=1 Tax=Camellia sinensis TaxID=4442 RepID=A0A7J7HI79_CAMSI|nr:hypothetical protein HYC85_010497 [Camellia sinensis]